MRIKDAPLAMIATVFLITVAIIVGIFVFIPPKEAGSSTPAVVNTYSKPGGVNLSIVKMHSPRQGFDFECAVAEKGESVSLSCNWP